MGTKTIGVTEEVYDRLRARKRDDESFTDLLDRLIDETAGDWRDGFGSLSAEEADSLRAAAERSRERFDRAASRRQQRATDQLSEDRSAVSDSADGDSEAASDDGDSA